MKKYLIQFIYCTLCFLSTVCNGQQNIANSDIILSQDTAPIRQLHFNSNGKYLTVISSSIVIWEIATKRKIFTYKLEKEHGCCVSKDGNALAIKHKQNEIFILHLNLKKAKYNCTSTKLQNRFDKIIGFVAQNQSLVVQQGNFHCIYGWQTGILQRKYKANPTHSYFISSNEQFAIEVDTMNHQFQLFDFQRNTSLAYFKYGKGEVFKNLYFDVDTMNRVIITHTGNKVRFWETFTCQRIPTKFIPEYEVSENERFWGLTHDFHYTVYGHDTLKMNYLLSKQTLSPVLIMEQVITAVALSKNSEYLAAGSGNGDIKICALNSEKLSAIYFAKNIETERHLIRPTSGEERPQDYVKRVKRSRQAILNKYLGFYNEMIAMNPYDKSLLQLFLNYERKRLENSMGTPCQD